MRPQASTASAEDVIDDWIQWLDDLHASRHLMDEDEGWAQDLLVVWRGLERLRPDLRQRAAVPELEQWLAETVRERGAEFATRATGGRTLDGWLEDARSLADPDDDALEDMARLGRNARELWEYLDHEHLLEDARRQWVDEPASASRPDRLFPLLSWLGDHAEAFLPAADYLAAAAATLRPDLADHDPDLALTAVKYLALLDAHEDMVVELQMGGLEPWPRAVVARLASEESPSGPDTAAAVRRWLDRVGQDVRARLMWRPALPLIGAAAAAHAASPDMAGALLQWRSDDGGIRAFIRLPAQAAPGERAALHIAQWALDGDAAAVISGVTVPMTRAGEGTVRGELPLSTLLACWDDDHWPTLVLVDASGRITPMFITDDG